MTGFRWWIVALFLGACSHPQHAEKPLAAGDAHTAGAGHSSHEHHAGHYEHRFEDAEVWAKIFDDPTRDEWQQPEAVISALKLDPGASVADLGAGTGYFSVRLARSLARGVVYGVDIEPDMIRYLDERAAREGLKNLKGVLGSASSANLPAPVDVVLVVDTYHHIPQRTSYFAGLSASLKPGARVVIIDYTKESPVGPPPEHRLTPAQVEDEMKTAGFHLVETQTFLPRQYLLVFTRVAH